MIVVYTTVPIDPDRREEAMAVVEPLVEHSREQDGTVRYDAMTDLTDEGVIRFVEAYEDADAAAAHSDSEPYRRFVEALPDVVAGEIETIQFEVDDVETVSFSAAEAVASLE